jgi:hypothetical protein
MNWAIQRYWYTLIDIKITIYGGERGIRTLETLLTLTHFPGVLLKPLGHLTVNCCDLFIHRSQAAELPGKNIIQNFS